MVNYQHTTSTTMCAVLPQDRTERARFLKDAYARGDAARDACRITSVAHTIYEWLIDYAKREGVAWSGEAALAKRLGKSVSTVKRRIGELVRAGLIVRQKQAGGRTSLTYIAAWLVDATRELLFGPKNGPSDGSIVAPDLVNSPDLNDPGGGGAPPAQAIALREPETLPPPTPAPPASPAVVELRAAGLLDERTIADVATTKPLALIRQAITYVQQVGKGPGLIVHLLRTNSMIPGAPAGALGAKEQTDGQRTQRFAVSGAPARPGHAPRVPSSPCAWTFIGGRPADGRQ